MEFNLILYIVASVVFIMVIHFGLAIKNQFNVWWIGGFFVLGGVIGYIFHSMEMGFVTAVVLSLIFW